MAPASSHRRDVVRVRMYRVGFGDCFLVSFPVPDGVRHLLVDFGVHPEGDAGTMPAVLDNLAAETDRRLAAVVASHEHADHLAGFAAFASRLSQFQIGEIWMPWTMDPEHPQAVASRQRRLALAETLHAYFRAEGGTDARSRDVLAILANLRGNEAALQALRSCFDGAARRIRYLKAGQRLRAGARQPDPAGIDGLVVRVLGPPSDPAFVERTEPPASQTHAHAGLQGPPLARAVRPFPKALAVAARDGRSLYGMQRADERAIAPLVAGPPHELACALDCAVNNTSLVLLLSFRGRGLLFPGDAQWAGWKHWLDAPEAAAVLEQVAFLKVAHHGSYSATPRRALEQMRVGGFSAFVPTQREPWRSFPRKSLIGRLAKRTRGRVVRSDSLRLPGSPGGTRGETPPGFTKGDFWYDCMVPL